MSAKHFSNKPGGYSEVQLLGCSILDASLDLLFKLCLGDFQPRFLVIAQVTKWVHLLHARFAKGDLGGEVAHSLHDIRDHICTLIGILPGKALEDGTAKACTGIGHGECGTAFAIFCIDDLSASILHPLVKICHFVCRHLFSRHILGEEWQDSCPSMTTDHWDVDAINRIAGDLMHKLVGPHAVKSGDANELLGIQALLLVQLTHGGHNRVHGVDNEAHNCIRAELADCLHDALSDTSIDAQKCCAVHARLSGQASRHQDKITACEALLELINGLVILGDCVVGHLDALLQMAQVSSHTCCGHHRNVQVIDTQLFDILIHSHEHAEWLTDATCTATNADLEVAWHPG